MKKIFKWFSREDLSLKDRWWHRLLSIIFYISFIIFIVYNIINYSYYNLFKGDVGVQQWQKVDTLSNRIVSEIKPIGALINDNEKVGENDRTYVLNDSPDPYYRGILNDVYCSTELANNYEKIKNSRGATDLYTGGSFSRNKVLPDEFLNYIKQYDVKCLTVDSFSKYNPDGYNFGKLTFLNLDKSYQDNWSIYEKSIIKTVFYFVEMIFITLIYSVLLFTLMILFYYKIIIYIIFGNKKK